MLFGSRPGLVGDDRIRFDTWGAAQAPLGGARGTSRNG
jgi:hypothetical protein